jgi:hypothetical protein
VVRPPPAPSVLWVELRIELEKPDDLEHCPSFLVVAAGSELPGTAGLVWERTGGLIRLTVLHDTLPERRSMPAPSAQYTK